MVGNLPPLDADIKISNSPDSNEDAQKSHEKGQRLPKHRGERIVVCNLKKTELLVQD